MKAIPAMDILGGKVVRLLEGNYSNKTIYSRSPVEMLAWFVSKGVDQIHVVDLDGAKGMVSDMEWLYPFTSRISIQFGGGIRSVDRVASLLSAGISKVILGSAFIKNPDFTLDVHSVVDPDQIILACDSLNGEIKIDGWQSHSGISLVNVLEREFSRGYHNFLCTDIARDGKLEGPSLSLYKSLKNKFPEINLIASGGIASLEDLFLLSQNGADQAVVGKALYENRIAIEEIIEFNRRSRAN